MKQEPNMPAWEAAWNANHPLYQDLSKMEVFRAAWEACIADFKRPAHELSERMGRERMDGDLEE